MLFKTSVIFSLAAGVTGINVHVGAPTTGPASTIAPDDVGVELAESKTQEKSASLTKVEEVMATLEGLVKGDGMDEKVAGLVSSNTIEAAEKIGLEEKVEKAKALYGQLDGIKSLLELHAGDVKPVGDILAKIEEAEAKVAGLQGEVEGLLGDKVMGLVNDLMLKDMVLAALKGDEEALDAIVQESMAKLRELAEETADDYQQKVEKMIADGVMDVAEKHKLDEKAAKAKEVYGQLKDSHDELMSLLEEASPETHATILAKQKEIVGALTAKVDELLGDGALSKLKELLVTAQGRDDNGDGVVDAAEQRRGRRVAGLAAVIEGLRRLIACCGKGSCCGKQDVVEVEDAAPEVQPLNDAQAPAVPPQNRALVQRSIVKPVEEGPDASALRDGGDGVEESKQNGGAKESVV